MNILAFDCATASCSAALWAAGQVLARDRADLARGQAEALLPMVAAVLARAGLGFADLDRLAATVGPGHFTGLRAGLAAARGLALATGLPLIGVTTLEAVAAGVPDAGRAGRTLLVALDSKLAESYVQTFSDDLRPLGPACAIRPEDAAAAVPSSGPLLVVGDAGPRFAEALRRAGRDVELSDAPPRPDAVTVACLAAGRPLPAAPPAPLYVHPPAVKLPVGA
ncbi:MAG: tRNA (adenosine(37)-N6)-threonylcarbamoyltransferase complex dimerization subunit type 1 TsaB [Rhodospirillales bacterium]|nr:tRNA (adenosine(37)-N6)-threonylcarbamoyltransferase complex dimerization subunit type 1 TsaB [Rhodospirillales bacterium]